MLNNQWKMKGFSDSRGVVATENAQKPLENEGFSEYGGAVATGNAQKPLENEDFLDFFTGGPSSPPTIAPQASGAG